MLIASILSSRLHFMQSWQSTHLKETSVPAFSTSNCFTHLGALGLRVFPIYTFSDSEREQHEWSDTEESGQQRGSSRSGMLGTDLIPKRHRIFSVACSNIPPVYAAFPTCVPLKSYSVSEKSLRGPLTTPCDPHGLTKTDSKISSPVSSLKMVFGNYLLYLERSKIPGSPPTPLFGNFGER